MEDGAVVLLTLAKPDALSLRLDVSLYFLLYGLPGPACGAQVPAAGIWLSAPLQLMDESVVAPAANRLPGVARPFAAEGP